MIVINVLCNNDKDLEFIIKKLITNNINYLYIDSSKELHFRDYIFRFKTKEYITESNYLYDLNYVFLIINLIIKESGIYISEIKSNNKKTSYLNELKQIQNSIKEKFKNNNINKKVLKKQLNPTRKIY
ncbi:MAG: hypothetical protein IJD92_04105 [Bacilli bacterium]|nr:hypothetical protein [Bacilli bacterium]